MKESYFLAPSFRWAMIAMITLLMSCGQKMPTGARLEGTVVLDGQPIEKGNIEFRPQDPGTAWVEQAEIREGRYVAEHVPLGKVLVLFHATRETGRTVLVYAHPTPEVKNLIPAPYRRGMALEIKGDNPKQDFELSSKGIR